MLQTITKFRADRSGASALLFSLVAPALLIGGGAAITYSQARSLRTTEQAALDSAVLSGARLPSGATDADRISAAQTAFNSQMSIVAGKLSQPASATFAVQTSAQGVVTMTGTASAAFANPFAMFVGARTINLGTSAAARTGFGSPICAYALNTSTKGAVDLNGQVNVSMPCSVQANSGSGSAVRSVGGASMTTAGLAVAGNYSGNGFTPAPNTGAPAIPDPLASLPFPTAGACAPLSGQTIKANNTIDPGTYCGGLKISSGAVVTLNPGIYLFTDGDFKIDSASQVNGTQVMLAFGGKGAKFWMAGGAVMKITSPTSGPYTNIQFMEDRNNPSGNTWVSIGGGSQLQYDGVMYFPLSNIWIFGGSVVKGNSPTIIMLGDKLWFQDNSTITLTQNNTRNLVVPATPTGRIGAVLTQ